MIKTNIITAVSVIGIMIFISGCTSSNGVVKEFYVSAVTSFDNDTLHVGFLPDEIIVNKGDTVIIHVNVTRPEFTQDRPFNGSIPDRAGMPERNRSWNGTGPPMERGFNRTDINRPANPNDNGSNNMHDFNIDEFNVHVSTPIGTVTDIEFVADKLGEFFYYSTIPSSSGNSGILKVIDSGDSK
jgi:hypothetical protein